MSADKLCEAGPIGYEMTQVVLTSALTGHQHNEVNIKMVSEQDLFA